MINLIKLDRQLYRIICCSNHIKYRVELFLAGLEDGNHYSLAERQRFLRSYQSNWDSLIPQKTITITIPDHGTYELAGGVYGLVPNSTPNSIQFYRLPSVSRGIEMEEWSIEDLDFSIDDFTMESAYDLLTVFTYKSGQYVYRLLPSLPCYTDHRPSVKVHLLKLSDGKPHPRARNPLLEYEIPLSPTENGWRLEVVIWENRLGCLFTSALENQWVDSLVVWDWTTGDLIRVGGVSPAHPFPYLPASQVLSQHGNRAFIFLDENTIVTGRPTENARPSLSFFDLSTDEKSTTPLLTLALLDEDSEQRGSLRIRLNLGIPIHHGPELRVRVPFFVNPSQQMLFTAVFFVDSDDDMTAMPHSFAISLSALREWARADVSLAEWNEWMYESPVPVVIEDPDRATFTMGSCFVTPDMDAVIDVQPHLATKASIPLLVYNLSPYHRVRVEWESSKTHCQGISGVWNTVAPVRDNGNSCRTTQIFAEPIPAILMTEDSLIVLEMVRP